MPKTNEVTNTDLKVIERLQQFGWRQGMLFYQQEFALTLEHQKKIKYRSYCKNPFEGLTL